MGAQVGEVGEVGTRDSGSHENHWGVFEPPPQCPGCTRDQMNEDLLGGGGGQS